MQDQLVLSVLHCVHNLNSMVDVSSFKFLLQV